MDEMLDLLIEAGKRYVARQAFATVVDELSNDDTSDNSVSHGAQQQCSTTGYNETTNYNYSTNIGTVDDDRLTFGTVVLYLFGGGVCIFFLWLMWEIVYLIGNYISWWIIGIPVGIKLFCALQNHSDDISQWFHRNGNYEDDYDFAGQSEDLSEYSLPLLEGGCDEYIYGAKYFEGDGVAQNYDYAMQWWQQAAARGDANSMIAIGWLYENGYGVNKDFDEAKEWYKKAVMCGNGMLFGEIYLENIQKKIDSQVVNASYDTVQQNEDIEQKYDAETMFNYGLDYLYGRNGTSQNYDYAKQWFEQAANLSHHANAMYYLGEIYRLGLGTAINLDMAAMWYNDAKHYGYKGYASV